MTSLEKIAEKLGWPKFRLAQIQRARETELRESWAEITTLSKKDREFLENELPFDCLKIVTRTASEDGSAVKFLLEAADGETFEMVLLLHTGEKKKWGTVCVSSQIGCPVGCKFCATGQMQLSRNLSAEEIIEQFIFAKRQAKKRGIERELNIVFMGMGEPCLNLEAVIPAIRTIIDPKRFGLSPSRVTVSSSGIVSGLKKLREAKLGIGLAISLHAESSDTRRHIMPIEESFSIEKVLAEMRQWEKSGTEILVEYILIDGVNDSPKQAAKLAELLKNRRVKINLIPLNPVPGSDLKRPAIEKMRKFLRVLETAGLTATLRHTKGDDIAAACGQLKTSRQEK